MAKKTVVVAEDGTVSFNNSAETTNNSNNQIENKEINMTTETTSPISNSAKLAIENPTARKLSTKEYKPIKGIQLINWQGIVTEDIDDAAYAVVNLKGEFETDHLIDRSFRGNDGKFRDAQNILSAFSAIRRGEVVTPGWHQMKDENENAEHRVIGYISAARMGKGDVEFDGWKLSMDKNIALSIGAWIRVRMVNEMPEYSKFDGNVDRRNDIDILLRGGTFKVAIAAIRSWVAGVSENLADENPVQAYADDVTLAKSTEKVYNTLKRDKVWENKPNALLIIKVINSDGMSEETPAASLEGKRLKAYLGGHLATKTTYLLPRDLTSVEDLAGMGYEFAVK